MCWIMGEGFRISGFARGEVKSNSVYFCGHFGVSFFTRSLMVHEMMDPNHESSHKLQFDDFISYRY